MTLSFFSPLLMVVLLSTTLASLLVTTLQASAPAFFPVEDRFVGSLPDTNTWLANQDQSSPNDGLLQDNGLHFIVPMIGGTNTSSWIWKSNLPITSDWSITLNVENLAASPYTNSFAGIGLNVGNTNNASGFGMALSYDPGAGGLLWESSLNAGSNSVMTTTNSSVKKGGLLLSYSAGSGTFTAAYCLHPEIQNSNWVSLGSASLDQLSLTNSNDTFEIAITASSSGIRLGRNNGLSAHDFTITNGAIGVNAPNPVAQFINLNQIGTLSYTTNPVRIHLPTASSGLPVNVSVESGPATLEGNRVHMLGTGTVTLLDTQAGNDRYGAISNTDFFTIAPAEQRITFPIEPVYTVRLPSPVNWPGLTVVGPSMTLQLKGTCSSGLPITYTIAAGSAWLGYYPNLTNSSTDGFLSIFSSTNETITIEANQSGDSDHYPAPSVTRSFRVNFIQPPSAGKGGGSTLGTGIEFGDSTGVLNVFLMPNPYYSPLW